MIRAAMIAAALLAGAWPAAAQDRILGLLTLPEVFGNGPCHPFEPATVALHASPGAAASIGSIEVDQHWSFAPHGGCEGLRVSVHAGEARAVLPTLEFANEAPAAVVLAVQDGWFKIRLTGGTAWLRASARDRFMPMADLFSEYPTLTALTAAHSGALRESPGGSASAIKPPTAGAPVRVLEIRSVGHDLWLQVAVMTHSICDVEQSGPPEVAGLGWVAAHAASGEPTVWFSSRGC